MSSGVAKVEEDIDDEEESAVTSRVRRHCGMGFLGENGYDYLPRYTAVAAEGSERHSPDSRFL